MSLLTSARKASASSLSVLEAEAEAAEREVFAVADRAVDGGGGGLVAAEEAGRAEFGAGGGFFPAGRTRLVGGGTVDDLPAD